MKRPTTLTLVCLVIGLTVSLAFLAHAATRTYEYLQKSIDTEFDYPATAWRCVKLEVEMGVEHPTGVLTFRGWKDMDSFFAGKPAMASRRVTINNAEQLTNYAPLFQELLGRVVLAGTFYGAEYKTVDHDDLTTMKAVKPPAVK